MNNKIPNNKTKPKNNDNKVILQPEFIPKKNIKYIFIHPTKCGGTALEQHFKKYYSNYIYGTGHNNIASLRNNPIIVIRDPIGRFISMYKYWKNGAIDTNYKRDNEWLEKMRDVSISDFINMIISKDNRLKTKFTWEVHYATYERWLKQNVWKNTIVIIYKPDLNESMHKLLNLLHINHKNEILPIKNKTKCFNENTQLNDDDMQKLKKYFDYDFKLYDAVLNRPNEFLYVIN